MATHSSVLAWRIPGTGEPGGLPSMGSHRVRHDCSTLYVYYVMLCLFGMFCGDIQTEEEINHALRSLSI